MKKQRDKKQFLKLCSKILRIGIAMTAAMKIQTEKFKPDGAEY